MNTENTTINQKEETNSIDSNDLGVSGKKYYSMKYIGASVLLLATCILSIVYFRSNLLSNNNENMQNVNSVSKNPSRNKSIKDEAKKREIIHDYLNDLLKNDGVFVNNLIEIVKQDKVHLPAIIKKIESRNIQITEDNVFDLMKSMIDSVIKGSKSALDYFRKNEKVNEKKIEEKSRNPRFLEEILFSDCYTKNCTSTCVHLNYTDPNLPILNDESYDCCLGCNLCCQCPALYVNPSVTDINGLYPERWTDYYRLQQIEHSLLEIARIDAGDLPGFKLTCPAPYDIFDYQCMPFFGKLCYDLYPEEGEYFKCKMSVNMKNNLLYCMELYINQTKIDRDVQYIMDCPYSAIEPHYGNCTLNYNICYWANIGFCSTIE